MATGGYLDTASSEPLHPAAREAMLAALDQGYADPRRLHTPARNARLILDNAREAVAEAWASAATRSRSPPRGPTPCTADCSGWYAAAATVAHSAVEHSAVLHAAGLAPRPAAAAAARSTPRPGRPRASCGT